ncbi:hypothetical protein PHYSODRAFT_528566 [Phytophthora sojae]|uniref:DDE-1 domain-containing protein n=1 Tax=Phytophthora sojae (strain P6497) TaxID=1094619 RepID=G5AAA2_PHYSP|nr:hypothetical protein PHYSODRAFT_528566 [Phytophthora sojae]EGZ07531.1 hypothetical protein PHYSODRAFT_528566 [Phytophthora sojae]|eukprot:XP_009537097.1 hypothetical protein PHYSODRAFT_528566 [Phytophthora sojae]
MRRIDLSLHRRTDLTTLSDDLLANFNPDHTVLMDETVVYFEDARKQTIQVRGARHVVAKSTGFASMRVTAAMAVTTSGVELPPLGIWKHKKGSRPVTKQGAVYVGYQPKAWVDSDLLCNWIDVVFTPVLQADGKAIIWDSMRAHLSKKAKAKCASRGISLCVIPGGSHLTY